MERWTMESQPFWTVMAETDALAGKSGICPAAGALDGTQQADSAESGMKWRYSLRWKRPGPCPGEPELASEVVEAGKPAPESVMSLWVAEPDMLSALIFCMKADQALDRRAKGGHRRRNLARRVNRIAPLFADELIGRELAARPDYYRGKSHR
jgi:hypothetical protein